MQNQRGFVGVGVLIAIILGIVVLGGGAYYVVQQQAPTQTATENFDNLQQLPITNNQPQTKTTTNAPAQTTPTQNPAPVASKITITAPATGATLQADQQTTIRWTIPSAVLDSFPQDFKLGLFINIQGQSGEGNVAGINDGTNDPRAGSVSWNIPAYFASGSLKSGVYKIVAYLQATPKDQSRLCARSVNKDCMPSEADAAVMQRSTEVKGETGWFTIVSSGNVKDNNAPVITSLTGPTSLRVGEKGTWLLTATDDTATSLKYSCHISLYDEMQASANYGGGSFMGSVEGTSLPDQYATPGTSVAFTFTSSKSTTGKQYYDISCNVGEPLPNNGELGARYQKSVQFTVSP